MQAFRWSGSMRYICISQRIGEQARPLTMTKG